MQQATTKKKPASRNGGKEGAAPSASNYTEASPQTLAGQAVLLELGAQLGLLDPLLSRREVSAIEAAKAAQIEEAFVSGYYDALASAGLAAASRENSNGAGRYCASPDLPDALNAVSYIVWALTSCAPLVSNARAFARDRQAAAEIYHRNGEHVARTSKWMGDSDWYPHAENEIISANPRKIVDLGSGSCRLLVRCLQKLPQARAVGIDLSTDACARATLAIKDAGLQERLTLIEKPIQSLLDDPTPLESSDVVHAGFVFHDLMPDEEKDLDAILKAIRENAPRGILVVIEAVPYAQNPEERAFSAAFTFIHKYFMGLKFLTEEGWKEKLKAAGYKHIAVSRLGASGGRIFTAKAA